MDEGSQLENLKVEGTLEWKIWFSWVDGRHQNAECIPEQCWEGHRTTHLLHRHGAINEQITKDVWRLNQVSEHQLETFEPNCSERCFAGRFVMERWKCHHEEIIYESQQLLNLFLRQNLHGF